MTTGAFIVTTLVGTLAAALPVVVKAVSAKSVIKTIDDSQFVILGSLLLIFLIIMASKKSNAE